MLLCWRLGLSLFLELLSAPALLQGSHFFLLVHISSPALNLSCEDYSTILRVFEESSLPDLLSSHRRCEEGDSSLTIGSRLRSLWRLPRPDCIRTRNNKRERAADKKGVGTSPTPAFFVFARLMPSAEAIWKRRLGIVASLSGGCRKSRRGQASPLQVNLEYQR